VGNHAFPGSALSPVIHVNITTDLKKEKKLTAIRLLPHQLLHRTLIGLHHLLLLNTSTAVVKTLGLIHGSLQRIPLPPKHVIGVRAVPFGPFEAPHERVRLSGFPEVVEPGGVPHRLVRDL